MKNNFGGGDMGLEGPRCFSCGEVEMTCAHANDIVPQTIVVVNVGRIRRAWRLGQRIPKGASVDLAVLFCCILSDPIIPGKAGAST